MASVVELVVVDGPIGAERWARARLEQLEQRWSRFLPHSELSRLNSAGGAATVVHPDTTCLLTAMIEGWHLGGGAFDPRSPVPTTPADPRPLHRRGLDEDLLVDVAAGTARLTSGVALDPGGIGKGLAADLVVRGLRDMGCAGALVGIGGDLAASGRSPEGSGWRIGVAAAGRAAERGVEEPIAWLTLEAGGAATSSVLHRHESTDMRPRQDHVDPRTGRTASGGGLHSVTVASRAGWIAEVHATAALLAGVDGAAEHLREHGVDGVLQAADGRRSALRFAEGALAC
jgi:thiamine biosynthesis lipoprotein